VIFLVLRILKVLPQPAGLSFFPGAGRLVSEKYGHPHILCAFGIMNLKYERVSQSFKAGNVFVKAVFLNTLKTTFKSLSIT